MVKFNMTRDRKPLKFFEQKNDMMVIDDNLYTQQKDLKNTNQMKLETEKNIASEIDNLMGNCDSTQTNNTTRKGL